MRDVVSNQETDWQVYAMSESGPSERSAGSISTSLLERVRANEQEAWERLVRLFGPLVLHWCRRAQLGEADRNDVSQEVFKAVALGIGGFRRERPGDTFRGWLRTITVSKLSDHFRRHASQQDGMGGTDAYQRLQELPAEATRSDEDSLADEDALLVRRALKLIEAEFEDRTLQAFWRTTVDGLTAGAVAEELGMTPDAVRKAKSRVLYRLRIELEDRVD